MATEKFMRMILSLVRLPVPPFRHGLLNLSVANCPLNRSLETRKRKTPTLAYPSSRMPGSNMPGTVIDPNDEFSSLCARIEILRICNQITVPRRFELHRQETIPNRPSATIAAVIGSGVTRPATSPVVPGVGV